MVHLLEKEFLFRANRALMLGVVGGGLCHAPWAERSTTSAIG